MNNEVKGIINSLAKMLYKMDGYEVKSSYDFSTVTHPQERACWNKAIVAWAFLMEDTTILKEKI